MKKKQEKKWKKHKKRKFFTVIYGFCGLFFCMLLYFAYFQWIESPQVITSSYNKRQDTFSDRVIRGEILTSDGIVLAKTDVDENGQETRSYPQGSMFSHVVGYNSHGKSGLELQANYQLLTSNAYFAERFWNQVQEEKNQGDSVYTTLDYELQKTAYNALGDYDGAVIVMEPSTGKILAMVSKPDYDPNEILENWDSISSSQDAVLLNRATQGLYAPGSVFKIITLTEYMREGKDLESFSYDCDGTFTQEEFSISCYHGTAHGTLDLKTAFAKSCNGAFAKMGLELNTKKFKKTCENLLFNQELPISMASSKSSFRLSEKNQEDILAQTAIGQGQTEVTPMHMAILTCAIANGGTYMKPYLIDHIESYEGESVKKYMPESGEKLFSLEESDILKEYMRGVVEQGTASALSGAGYTVAGKTGTAEFSNDKSQSHAWFVGFSNVDDPDLVVCVLVEKAGSGSKYAVPIAKKIFDAYYQ